MSWYSTIPNPQVLDLAKSYNDAAKILANAKANSIPIINLQCHAIELFLKSLHLKDESIPDGNVFILRPRSGHDSNHDLINSFKKAQDSHRKELECGMPELCDNLKMLEGIFQQSRYLYEKGGSLPLSVAARVSQYLEDKVPNLE